MSVSRVQLSGRKRKTREEQEKDLIETCSLNVKRLRKPTAIELMEECNWIDILPSNNKEKIKRMRRTQK